MKIVRALSLTCYLMLAYALSGCTSPTLATLDSQIDDRSVNGDEHHDNDSISVGTIHFPTEVDGITWTNINNYAQDGGAGGFGASFRNPDIKLDIFFYTAASNDWVGLPVDQRLSMDVATFETSLKEVAAKGFYSKLELGAPEQVVIEKLPFTHVPVSFVEKAGKRKSHYYITSYRDKLLKIRLTSFTDASDDKLNALVSELTSSFLTLNGRSVK